MSEQKLHFDNARFAQQLFNNEPANLRALEDRLGLKVTARDGWIRLTGADDAIADATTLFQTLEKSLKAGARIRNQDFLHALEVLQGNGAAALQALQRTRIETSPRKAPIAPKNPGQQRYLEAIEKFDVTFGIGPAGTGKTYLAMAMAVRALRDGETSRIILTRPAVEAGEALGFLPGDLYEKLDPYLRPLHDALYDMMPVDEIQKHRERGTIEIAPLAYMRGRTLNNAFIILDEAQNTTAEQMLMFLTRLGFNSKAVVTGDPSQVDLPNNKKSGLHEAVRALGRVNGISLIEFARRDIVRHPLVQRIIAAYEEHRRDD